MSAKTTRVFLENWRPKVVPPRTLRAKPRHINTVTCRRCLGATLVIFQWFGMQTCPDCDGTGESDE